MTEDQYQAILKEMRHDQRINRAKALGDFVLFVAAWGVATAFEWGLLVSALRTIEVLFGDIVERF